MTAGPRQEIRPDICVIGGGAGGLAAASAAAAFGVNVVLIENGKTGGDGLALPSKALLAAADRAQIARNGVARDGAKAFTRPARFGADFAAVRAHVHDAVAAVAPQDSRERFKGLGVRIVEGEGRFTDAATVAVNGFDIKARRFVIATGSSPVLPPIPGLADVPLPDQRDRIRCCRVPAPPDRHRRRRDRARIGASVPPLGRGSHRDRGGDAARGR